MGGEMQEILLNNMLTLVKAKEQLKNDAYVRIPFSFSDGVIDRTAETFIAFTRLPAEVKEKFSLPVPLGENKCNEVGFKHYSVYDSKPADIDWFQYNPTYKDRLQKESKGGPEATEMLQAMHRMYEEACDMFNGFVEVLESGYPDIRSKIYTDNSPYPTYSALRFIRYGTSAPSPDTHLYLTEHFDSGGCTLPVAQSGPGLLVGHSLDDLKPVTSREDEVEMFPGLNWYKITDVDFAPSLHVVDPKLNKEVAHDVSRWVAIFFVDHSEFKKCDVCDEVHW